MKPALYVSILWIALFDSGAAQACRQTRLLRSKSLIEVVLKDIMKTYNHVGGGISGIRETATDVYEVSISQEERIDILVYTVATDTECKVSIKGRQEKTKSFK